MLNLRTVATVAVIGAALYGTIASGSSSNDATKVDDNGAATAATEFAVGDIVELGDWRVQVHGVTDPYLSSNEFLAAPEGSRYVVVDTEVTNNDDAPTTVSSIMCFDLRDAESRSYSITFVDTPTGSVDGEVAAGSSRRGDLAFEVPTTATGLKLEFKCDLFSSGSATINLS